MLHCCTILIVGPIHSSQKKWAARQKEIDPFPRDVFNELGLCILVELSFGSRKGAAGAPKRSPQIAHYVSMFSTHIVNSIVNRLEIPVVDQRHQDAQAVQFACVSKGVHLPFPLTHFLLST